MKQDQVDNKINKLLFDVRRSVRYHDRRRSFFGAMKHITAVLGILTVGQGLFQQGNPQWWFYAMGASATLLTAINMVVSYESRANSHRILKDRFGALEIEILNSDDSEKTLQNHTIKRLVIERDEPPIYRALDIICHNELILAHGYDKKNFYKIGLLKKLTRHFFYWSLLKS